MKLLTRLIDNINDYNERRERRKEKERAGMLVCARCKSITMLGYCGINDMELGKVPNFDKPCVVND